jgi:methylmalonyl-CoA carboxyltransferase small subunit
VKLRITVDGKVYEVDVEVAEPEPPQPSYMPMRATIPAARPAAAPLAAAPPVAASTATVADESKVCRSPISGVVVRVSAQVSQSIQLNDILMVLEAMKMETTITSPVAGKVGKVNVHVGDSVSAGQVVVEFE